MSKQTEAIGGHTVLSKNALTNTAIPVLFFTSLSIGIGFNKQGH